MNSALKNNWFIVCPSDELRHEFKTTKMFGKDVLLYRDTNGKPVALEDRCCHRNVHLSLGYLKDDTVVCGYHGWEYDKTGQCTFIPSQLSDAKIPPKACIKNYPVKEFNKWIWVFPGDNELANKISPIDIPEMDELDFTYGTYVFEADLESTAESLIDPYHIAYTHRDSIKSLLGQIEEYPADFNMDIVEDGVIGYYNRTNRGNVGEKIYFGDQKYHKTNFRFYFPNFSELKVHFKDKVLIILEHVMPVDENNVSMTQITLWKNIFPKFPWFAKKFMSRKSDTIVKEDIVFLTSQKRIYDNKNIDAHEVSVKGDEVSLAFRKFWRNKLKEAEKDV